MFRIIQERGKPECSLKKLWCASRFLKTPHLPLWLRIDFPMIRHMKYKIWNKVFQHFCLHFMYNSTCVCDSRMSHKRFPVMTVMYTLAYEPITTQLYLTHSCLRVPLKTVVWIYDTFDNNLGIKNSFTQKIQNIYKRVVGCVLSNIFQSSLFCYIISL